jgi:hypothetical protein
MLLLALTKTNTNEDPALRAVTSANGQGASDVASKILRLGP